MFERLGINHTETTKQTLNSQVRQRAFSSQNTFYVFFVHLQYFRVWFAKKKRHNPQNTSENT